MTTVRILLALVAAYVLGSIPTGFLIIRGTRRRDLTKWHSGRTGGTNAARVGGFWVGLFTAIGDGLKAAAAVWLARWLTDGMVWIEVLAGAIAVFGHNNSIFLYERKGEGWRLGGGAGGASSVGAAFALHYVVGFLAIPIGVILLFVVGYASIATMSIGVSVAIIFAIRAAMGLGPWEYVAYGILVELMVLWALRPNIKRLLNGEERVVGLRALRTKQMDLSDED
jgi:glycerol-3-phosphate acyltransferase PlsY